MPQIKPKIQTQERSHPVEICAEKHKRIDEILEIHDKRLNAHSLQIDDLMETKATHAAEIKNLCEKIGDLIQTTKWFIGIMVTGYIGFFFYVIQSKL